MPPAEHPILSGTIVGVVEICFTFPLEAVKRKLQLQQQASALDAIPQQQELAALQIRKMNEKIMSVEMTSKGLAKRLSSNDKAKENAR